MAQRGGHYLRSSKLFKSVFSFLNRHYASVQHLPGTSALSGHSPSHGLRPFEEGRR